MRKGEGLAGEKNPAYKHGGATRTKRSREYIVWCHMKSRCLNKNSKDFRYYGGRGISICDQWVNSFDNFLSDMGLRPTSKHSIDRIDVNGNYEPNNCRWVTQNIQVINSRKTTNESGYRGLSKRYSRGKWFGNYQVLCAGGYIGFTNDPIKGAQMYDRAAIKKYGQEAFLNFPDLREQYLKELADVS